MARLILPATGRRRVPIRVWGRAPPEGALEQLDRLAAQPYVVEHIAAMPDLHVARGVAVGTVFATLDTVVPAALGADLGCGVSAVRFDFPAARLSRRELERLLEGLGAAIPVGEATHRGRGVEVPEALLEPPLSTASLEHSRRRLAPRHLGTLGGGNHFVELDRDGNGDLWLLVHSGSRGLGAAIAAHHLRVAEAVGTGDLPGLSVKTPEGQACLEDVGWATAFAAANRAALLELAMHLVGDATGVVPEGAALDVVHNFVREEHHKGGPLLVHRKGAIAAPAGARALIPGTMGTASYLVEGRGEPSAFASASHGAGRVMTRTEARRGIAVERLEASLKRVVYDPRRLRALVEEAPAAYRDIRQVLDDEEDLVRPVARIEPLAVLKGGA